MTDRNAKFASQQHRGGTGRAARAMEAVGFFNVLAGPELLETTEAYLPAHRERERVRALTRQTGELLSTRAQRGWRWRGRVVKLVDGTGISMGMDILSCQTPQMNEKDQPGRR